MRLLPSRRCIETMSECPNDNVVAEFVAGVLDGNRRRATELHLDSCPTCRAIVAQLAQAIDPTYSAAPATPPDLTRRVAIVRASTDDGPGGHRTARAAGAVLARGSVPPPVTIFPGGDRFAQIRWLGGGGMGVVYEVLDRVRGEHVALKTLRLSTPDQLLRFKNEFRAVQDLHHPNLVTLGELVEAGGAWFFTMELVHGVDFVSYVRGRAGEIDLARLRGALGQLADGLSALHAAGKIHRDIKPSNVLVTDQGRVVVLDFGLIADIGGRGAISDEHTVGTALYMAPEQAAGHAVGPAADWYAVGVMLHEVLTGEVPFGKSPLAALLAKQQEPSPDPDLLAARHGELGRLCAELLRVDPAARAGAAEVRAVAEGDGGVSRPPDAVPAGAADQAAFVGRRAELIALAAALERARTGRTTVVYLEGDSGIGKSALVRRFLAGVDQITVLAGRCYERELVPYKAVDGLVDALCRHLRHLSDAEVEALLGADADLLSRVFPVMQRVPAIARRRSSHGILDGHELRARVFTELHTVLARLATDPLILVVDDLQWSDADSLVLLEQLLHGSGAVPALAIFAARPGWSVPPWIGDDPSTIRLALRGLDREDAIELTRQLTAPGSASLTAARMDQAGGHPLLLAEMVRHTAADGSGDVDLQGAVWWRISRLEAPLRELLELIAVAGTAVPIGLVAAAVAVRGDFDRHHAALRAQHLVRTATIADTVDTYHDVVREVVRARLPEEVRRERHRALARAAESAESLPPDMLAVHWQEAGEPAQAARWARIGGERALAQLAFDHAARLFQLSLELDGASADRRRILERLAEALSYAGRGPQAAEAYLAAAALADDLPAIELRRRAAEQLLLSGHIDEGRARLREVAAVVDLAMPSTQRRALLQLVLRRVRVALGGLRRRARALTDRERVRVDLCYSASTGLISIDPLRSSFFHAQELLLARRGNDAMRLARALAFEISFNAGTRGPEHRSVRRSWRAAEALAAELRDPHVEALVDGNAGAAALLGGRWREATELCARAERTLRERCIGVVWELDAIQLVSLTALWYTGRLADLVREVPRRLREACERGDRLGSTCMRSGLPFGAWLVIGDDAAGERELAAARQDWSQEEFHVAHAQMLHADVLLALYRGDATRARTLMIEARPPMRRALLHHIDFHRTVMSDLDGRVALASAQVPGLDRRQRRQRIADARAAARRLGRNRVAWARALAEMIHAELMACEGDTGGAAARMAAADAAFTACDMTFHAVVARRRRGQLLGAEGEGMVVASDQWLRDQAVARPVELVSVLAPGTTPDRWH